MSSGGAVSGTTGESGDFAEGFAARLSPGARPAVLSIDLMRAYFEPSSPLCLPSDGFLATAGRVLAAARAAGVPVLHTVVRFDGEADGGVFMRKIPALRLLIGDNPMGRPMPQVDPEPGEPVLVKRFASAFFGTDLAERLRELGVDTVVVVGTSTSGCVRATAVDAIQHGFIPIVVADAVGDRDEAVHRASLYDLQAKYAEVMGSADVIAYLEESSAPGGAAAG
ncbi:isochorismatase family protein [Arthrobacter halodurans]|uniref:Isochorismatase family protein n=1 Tax=Arthrobacter halodurans TaxID=516699 RepID=A0ABV4UUT1_9MICC